MLRYLLVFLFIFFALPALAQEVADSSAIRLEKYKKQYEEGVITRQQYEVMVKKEEYNQKFEKDSTGYKRRYIPNESSFTVYAGGSVAFSTKSGSDVFAGGMVGVAYKYHIKSAMILAELDFYAFTNKLTEDVNPTTSISLGVPFMVGYNGDRAYAVAGGVYYMDMAYIPNPEDAAGNPIYYLAKDGGLAAGFGYGFPLPKRNAVDVQLRYTRLFKSSVNVLQLSLGYNF